jgi:hypothetical protein
MPKRQGLKKAKQSQLEQAIAQAQSEFFGGITKEEALEVFKTLAVLKQFPGANPPEPLNGCYVHWTSTLEVGDTLDKQTFNVRAIYKGLTFDYTKTGERAMQLPDCTYIAFESWDYQALRIANIVKEDFVYKPEIVE